MGGQVIDFVNASSPMGRIGMVRECASSILDRGVEGATMGMQLDFSGKRVLVTGSTKGIGRGAAEGFHELGASVAINGRTAETVAQTIEEMGGGERLIAAPGDLSSVAGVDKTVSAAIAELGGLDVLVNNAGRGDDRPIDGIDEDYWQMMIDLNLKGAFFTAQACVPALKESRGNIINIASMMGVMGGPEGLIVYCTTKGAMIQMTRMMALDLSRDGVRVNNLCPGWIDTPMIQNENQIAGDDALLNYINADCPLGRIGHVDETTGAILYFASHNAGYTTGATLVADGGISAGR